MLYTPPPPPPWSGCITSLRGGFLIHPSEKLCIGIIFACDGCDRESNVFVYILFGFPCSPSNITNLRFRNVSKRTHTTGMFRMWVSNLILARTVLTLIGHSVPELGLFTLELTVASSKARSAHCKERTHSVIDLHCKILEEPSI